MAIIATKESLTAGFDFQIIQNASATPVLATDAIAAEVGAAKTDSRGNITGYEWTPLSSYLGEMRTKIARQQLFDGCSA